MTSALTPSESASLLYPWPENLEIKTYSGSCHCKAVSFEIQHPDIDKMTLFKCNCSICVDRGYVNVLTPESRFKFTKGSAEDLTGYAFGAKKVIHRFCSTCGTTIGALGKGFVVVNTRTLENVDTDKLETMPVDGKSRV
ncbi:Mss4-like protein [Mycena sp. CBHHK59/15]|nr:Mss4-like protein [Mycena sp. CBHHK59/15]